MQAAIVNIQSTPVDPNPPAHPLHPPVLIEEPSLNTSQAVGKELGFDITPAQLKQILTVFAKVNDQVAASSTSSAPAASAAAPMAVDLVGNGAEISESDAEMKEGGDESAKKIAKKGAAAAKGAAANKGKP